MTFIIYKIPLKCANPDCENSVIEGGMYCIQCRLKTPAHIILMKKGGLELS